VPSTAAVARSYRPLPRRPQRRTGRRGDQAASDGYDSRVTVQPQVLIVGAGFSGIGVAAGLRKAGFEDFLIVDDGDGYGGTWNWNRYPGVAVDIPSFSYQYSFAKRTSWSRVYAPGAELRDYAERCAERFDLRPKTRFHTHMSEATFDEDAHTWHLKTSEGESIDARHVIDASGVLTVPKLPDIDGLDTFAGVMQHTARWDHSQDLRGKRVAVIGTGASAVQVIPAIAGEVEHLTVFQRTPIWCLPKLDAPLPGPVRWILNTVPGGASALRTLSQTFVEMTFPVAAHYHGTIPLASMFENSARSYLRQQVEDPELRDKLTPRYALGCKRPSFHNEYLATFNRENVTLETDPIARITETGIETESGSEHAVDVLVLATGFKVFDPGNVPKYPVTGRDGLDLDSWWRENRSQAYEGVSVPGFPNYFWMFGPYSYNGSSYFNLIETQSRHIVRVLEHAREQGATMIEVRREANDRYFAEMLRRRGRQVFWQDSCALANSYYFDPHGDVPLRPVLTLETMWRSRRFPLGDYRLESLVAAEEPLPAAV
jgi:cation diffusion facilitator CzcD-associated flavoprotein CzcO